LGARGKGKEGFRVKKIFAQREKGYWDALEDRGLEARKPYLQLVVRGRKERIEVARGAVGTSERKKESEPHY
jgi:hypothetical protein